LHIINQKSLFHHRVTSLRQGYDPASRGHRVKLKFGFNHGDTEYTEKFQSLGLNHRGHRGHRGTRIGVTECGGKGVYSPPLAGGEPKGRGKCKTSTRNLKQETAGASPAVIARNVA